MPASVSEVVVFPAVVYGPAAGDPRSAASVRSMGDGLSQRLNWTWDKVQQFLGSVAPIGGKPTPLASCNTSTGAFTLNGHGLQAGDAVRLFVGAAGGTCPTSTPTGQIFWAVAIDANTFGLAATFGGAQLTSLGGGLTGEVYVVQVTDALSRIYFPTVGSVQANTLRGLLSLIGFLAAGNTWTGSNTFQGTTFFTGLAGFTNAISRSGANARYQKRAPYTVPDADTTVDPSMSDTFILTPNTANRTLTLRQTTAPPPVIGEGIRVICPSGSTGTWTVRREGGASPMVTFASGAGGQQSADFEVRDSGASTPHWTLGPWSLTGGPGPGADAF